jgi:phosphoribosylaminoimidazole-succinocarboxamide synthase
MRIVQMNSRRTRIYEGKAKILYEGPEPGTIIVHFKDDATAFNAQKKAVIEGKGVSTSASRSSSSPASTSSASPPISCAR